MILLIRFEWDVSKAPGLHKSATASLLAWPFSSWHWLKVSPVIPVKSDGQLRKWVSLPWQLSFLPSNLPASTFDETRDFLADLETSLWLRKQKENHDKINVKMPRS